tara:strand:+ start:669 stop:950 length:282 start_codon:yes stop_codon:yes gene_type:complete
MPQYNIIGQEINVGDLVFDYEYPFAGRVSRITEKKVFYEAISLDPQGNERWSERSCKPNKIFKTDLVGLQQFVNAPNTNDYRRKEVERLMENL